MRGHFGIGVYHTKTPENIGTLMRSAYAFGAAYVFTVGRRYRREASDTTKTWRHIPLYHYGSIEDLKSHLPFCTRLVAVELIDGAISLPAYAHPQQACYLLGAEDHGLNDESLALCHDVIQVPGATRCLNVATAGSIVLYDRVTRLSLLAPEGKLMPVRH